MVRLGGDQVLGGAAGAGRVGPGVHHSGARAGELGVRFARGPHLLLHVLGEPPPTLAAVAAELLAGVSPGGVGLGGQARPLEVARVAWVAGRPRRHGPVDAMRHIETLRSRPQNQTLQYAVEFPLTSFPQTRTGVLTLARRSPRVR